eukprot:Polyplicarium_translucidae@DN4481_c0_g1_i1.p1
MLQEALSHCEEQLYDVPHAIFCLFCDLFDVTRPPLTCHVLEALGVFLKRRRDFVRSRRLRAIIKRSLSDANDPQLALSALRVLHALLVQFERDAAAALDEEPLVEAATPVPSATASAQPLALHAKDVLTLCRRAASSDPDSPSRPPLLISALRVVELLTRQGLVNPLSVIATMFSLLFSAASAAVARAATLLRSVWDAQPEQFVNALPDAVRCAAEERHAVGDRGLPEALDAFASFYDSCVRPKKLLRERVIRTLVGLVDRSTDAHVTSQTEESASVRLLEMITLLLCRLPFAFESEARVAIDSLDSFLASKAYAVAETASQEEGCGDEELKRVGLACVTAWHVRVRIAACYRISSPGSPAAPPGCQSESPGKLPSAARVERPRYDEYHVPPDANIDCLRERLADVSGAATGEAVRECLSVVYGEEFEEPESLATSPAPRPTRRVANRRRTAKRHARRHVPSSSDEGYENDASSPCEP